MYKSLEICAGAGGQALGLEQAGFEHVALVEIEQDYCECLRLNRPKWNVICQDIHHFDGRPYKNRIDLLSGGVPCPPFSVAGKQLGNKDERDLFPEMLRLVMEIRPKVVMIENVRGLLTSKFDQYRYTILVELTKMGYNTHIQLLNASDYGVPQLRPRVIIVGISDIIKDTFVYPFPHRKDTHTVGETLYDLMASNGWEDAESWRKKANDIAPTIVGGSKKHGGADLGPSRARMAWATLGVDGRGVADESPAKGFIGMPRLTPRMIARIQGFPDDWSFGDKKTKACRMIRNKNEFPIYFGTEPTVDKDGIPSNADRASELSKFIARHIANSLMAEVHEKIQGQTSGAKFEQINMAFLTNTFPFLQNIRPGKWHIEKLGNRSQIKTSNFVQYAHLEILNEYVRQNADLATSLGNDYMVAPDVVIYREAEPDETINNQTFIIDTQCAKLTDIRKANGGLPILHASISAKWTIRSDRAQNSRTEALGLIRNRKGHLPHIVVVTAEPLPSRLASLALGTGDIDCVYHFALPELRNAVDASGAEDSIEMLQILIEGKRLKDISDLPLDLAV